MKNIIWQKKILDGPVLLFITSVAISTLFSSPNKIQALLNLNFGLGLMVFLGILYFCISRSNVGVGFSDPKKGGKTTPLQSRIYHLGSVIFSIVALSLTIYSMFRAGHDLPLQVPPFRLSWLAALEIFKNPRTALIGVGPDNFSSIFTKVKDFTYNQSPLWNINSFNVSHSAILQILTETGIFGLLSFGLLIFYVFRQLISTNFNKFQRVAIIFLFIYLFISLFALPPSLIIWFLFFVTISLISSDEEGSVQDRPLYNVVVPVIFALIIASSYFLGRAYLAEFYFKKSIDAVANNDLMEVYNNQRRAIILNPYIEKFHIGFAQTNLLIANNIAQKKAKQIGKQDSQTISQAIQAGIAEAKSVVSLNPQKADNWQNLALTYQNVIGVAQGADAWTIAAYERAIMLDPQNPVYRVGLGGVYYNLKKYEDASRFFEQGVALKPDWASANYNLAWANFQLKRYSQAVSAMENTLKSINPKTNKIDYDKVNKELADFRKMLPTENQKTK